MIETIEDVEGSFFFGRVKLSFIPICNKYKPFIQQPYNYTHIDLHLVR